MILTADNAIDTYRIVQMAKEFIEESHYGVTFDYDIAYERITEAIHHPDGDVIYIKDGDEVAAACKVWAVADWQKEKFGYVEKFYVRQPYRAKGYSRLLAQEMAEWFDHRGCVCSFATATANIGNNRLFANLLAKYAYQPCGDTLYRLIQIGQTDG